MSIPEIIAFLADCKQTHDEWIAYYDEGHKVAYEHHVGDRQHHVEVSTKYGMAIAALKGIASAPAAGTAAEEARRQK